MFAEDMDWPPMDSTFYRVGTFMEKSVIQHADLLLASSQNTADFSARHYGCALDRIQVVFPLEFCSLGSCPKPKALAPWCTLSFD
jgi:hypothetical protein